MGHLDRLEERVGPTVDHVGDRAVVVGAGGLGCGVVPSPSLGLTAHDHGNLGAPVDDGGERLVDQGLLGDAELGQVGPGGGTADRPGHQATGSE